MREHIKVLGTIKYVESKNNFADILTKNVKVTIFERLAMALLKGFKGYEDSFQFSKHQRENIWSNFDEVFLNNSFFWYSENLVGK